MAELKNVIHDLPICIDFAESRGYGGLVDVMHDALELLKAQEQRHRLEVHNIGNVDIPEGVTEEQFHAVMNNVVEALEHTDKGESWPYENEEG